MITTDLQIRFTDIDAQGHVNNVNMQFFFDIGKRDYFVQIMGSKNVWKVIGVVAANTNINFYAPTFIDDNIAVTTSITKIGNKSLTFFQQIIDRNNGSVKADSTSILVSFDIKSQQGVVVPENWIAKIKEHEQL